MYVVDLLPLMQKWAPARVKVVVAHFMQPVAVYRDSN